MSLEWAVSHRSEYDITTTYKINEPGELVFKILTKDNVDAYRIGQVIEYDDKVFIVDKLDIDRDDYSITTVTCQQNAINLSKKICGAYEYIAETVQTLAGEVLKGSGWTLGRTDIPSSTKRHLISEEETVLSNLNTIAENFGAVLIFNYNTVDILMQKGSELTISDESNLSTISVTKDGGNIITRLHAFGGVDKETGIETTILDHTNGLTYVEDYSFFLEQGFSLSFIQSRPDLFLREAVYRNTDLYDSQALYNAAVTQLEAQMYPEITCQVKVVDNGTPIELNMAATIYDSETETHFSARVTEVSVNKDNPAEIEVELSNVVGYGSWVSDVITKVDRIDSVINETNKNWQEIIQAAKEEATKLLYDGMENSHVIVKQNAIIVGDAENFDDMTRYWLWNKNGLGHINKDDGEGGLVNVAMTMDGAIVADRITAGELNGAIIKAGTIKADALEVEAYEKIQQGINIGATNYIRNSGNFTDSKYWLGNATYREVLLHCNGEVRNVTNIPLAGGEEYIYSATIITESDIEITEDNLILGYTAYQPVGVSQTRALSEEELAKELPIIITKARTYETLQGSDITIGFESSKTLKSLKLSINNGEDFNYEGTISGENAIFKLSHLVYGNYICQLVGEDANGNKGYSKTFIINIATSKKDSVIFSNIGIAKPYEIKANVATRVFLKYKARDDLKNGFIINPTININGSYKIKNVQWEKGNIASDWKANILDVSDGALNEARTYFNVEAGKIVGRVEEIEKNYATNDKIDDAINDAKNDINEQIKDVNDQIGKLEDDLENIALDGIIDEIEAKLIAENITQLNKEKADVDVRFNNLYGSVLLTGEARTKLNEAKNFFDLKHTALLNKINQIIEDNLLNESEMVEFKKAIEQYQSALALLSKAFDDAIANIAENVANNYTNEKFAELVIELDKISLSVGDVTTELSNYKRVTDEKISKIEITANDINMSVSQIQESVNLIESENNTLKAEQDKLKDYLDNVDEKVDNILDDVGGAIADGIIDEAEALMIAKRLSDFAKEKDTLINQYNNLYNNIDLTGTAKSNLYSAKTDYVSKFNVLINIINTIIADSKVNDIERNSYDTAINNYNTSYISFSQKLSLALENIQSNLGAGYIQSITDYKNELKNDIGSVNSSLTDLENEINGAYLDGIIDEIEKASINEKISILEKDKATLDKQYSAVYTNADLTGTAKTNLLSSKTSYDTAYTNLKSDFNKILNGTIISNISTKISTYNTAIADLSEKLNRALDSISATKANTSLSSAKAYAESQVKDVSNSLNSFQNTVNGTFKDGIIDKAEALALEKQIKLLNIEKADIDNMYTTLYSNTDLTGTAKSNLYSAKTSYNSAHTNLINSINSAISDNKITTSEQTAVNNAFTTYSSALATYSKRHEEAIDSVAEKKKQDAMSYTNTKMAEINITPDAIISTVRNSQLYKNDLSGKVSQTDLSSAINQSATSIKQEVSATYPTNESVSNSFNNLDKNLQNTYATKTLVTQTADSITHTVSKKVGKDEVVSSINQTAESIKIKASKLELDGNTLLKGALKLSKSTDSSKFAELQAVENNTGVNMLVTLGGSTDACSFEVCNSTYTRRYFWTNYQGTCVQDNLWLYSNNTSGYDKTSCRWSYGSFYPTVNNKGYLGLSNAYWNTSFISNMNSNDFNNTNSAIIGKNLTVGGNTASGTFTGQSFYSTGWLEAVGQVKGQTFTCKGNQTIGGTLTVGSTTEINGYTVVKNNSFGVEKNIDCNGALTVGGTTTLKGYTVIKNNSLGVESNIYCNGVVEASRLAISGSKNCVQDTESYGKRLVNAYETADYLFGDLGESEIEGGECIVWIDDMFKEIISTDYEYQVFITKYGRGDIWVSERHHDYFVVQADNDISFGWEIKGKRKGYENYRLEKYIDESVVENSDE